MGDTTVNTDHKLICWNAGCTIHFSCDIIVSECIKETKLCL